MLEQFRVSDFLEWNDSKSLVINRDFQRGSVWSPAAKIMLIDTILRDYPIPKIYIRSIVDRDTKKIKREVVDGQQRLRAIIDFAGDKITLSNRAKEFKGKRFSTLSDEEQDRFLQYPIAVDQLVNADDRLVLDIFARLNSYNVKLNSAELRHAAYQGEFKWSVHEMAGRLHDDWIKFGVFSAQNLVRMDGDSFVAELYGVLLDGIQDGGQPNIEKFYKTHDESDNFDRTSVEAKFDKVYTWISTNLLPDLIGTPLVSAPHLLLLFAAVANCLVGIPRGALAETDILKSPKIGEPNKVRSSMEELATVIGLKEEPGHLQAFWRASNSSTQRIASRRVRYPFFEAAARA